MGWQEIFIVGVTGLGSGTLGALAGSWSKWRWADKPQRKEDRRAAFIEQSRSGIRHLRDVEKSCIARNEERAAQGLPALEDLDEADPMWHEWFRDLQDFLAEDAVERVEQLRRKPVKDRLDEIPDLLEEEVRRIRSEWGLL